MVRRTLLFALCCSAALAAEPLRVLTFNVRYPARGDGPNLWTLRRDLLVDTVRALAPTVMGTQELFHEQGQYIAQKLPEYRWFGVSRRGDREDEHMGVFYRHRELRLVSSGNFWLSETPDAPASIAWNMSLPRMATWGVFETAASKRRFFFLNTHFAHRREDEDARRRSAEVIRRLLPALAMDLPVIVTGDFNAPAGGETYRILAEGFTDAWQTAPHGPAGTFHGFTGKPGEARIDWILIRGPWRVARAETVTRNEGGRYPSDHFPVLASLEWR